MFLQPHAAKETDMSFFLFIYFFWFCFLLPLSDGNTGCVTHPQLLETCLCPPAPNPHLPSSSDVYEIADATISRGFISRRRLVAPYCLLSLFPSLSPPRCDDFSPPVR